MKAAGRKNHADLALLRPGREPVQQRPAVGIRDA